MVFHNQRLLPMKNTHTHLPCASSQWAHPGASNESLAASRSTWQAARLGPRERLPCWWIVRDGFLGCQSLKEWEKIDIWEFIKWCFIYILFLLLLLLYIYICVCVFVCVFCFVFFARSNHGKMGTLHLPWPDSIWRRWTIPGEQLVGVRKLLQFQGVDKLRHQKDGPNRKNHLTIYQGTKVRGKFS